jgi:hypothetical protein
MYNHYQGQIMSTQTQDDMLAGIANRAGFTHGDDSVAMFLAAVFYSFPQINKKEKFLALAEDRREEIIIKVKTRHLANS